MATIVFLHAHPADESSGTSGSMARASSEGHRVVVVYGTDLLLADGLIQAVGGGSGDIAFDATGLLVLPGIVDIHGDAFERQMQPRPGVDFPADLALRDTEAQC